jgi:collagenase-like PrtC family protease
MMFLLQIFVLFFLTVPYRTKGFHTPNIHKKVNVSLNAKTLPDSELIRRRKSPALWREEEHEPTDKEKHVYSGPKVPPEIMAPAGGFPQLKAAIANGADSVYLGLSAFSARARASNFSPNELKEAVNIAHKSGVRVFVALNVLVFQHELHEVAEWIHICDQAGVDAIIVQDIGVTKLARKIAPNLEIHASTQQTVTNTDGVIYAKERGGANRVVLGRELSIKEIQDVTRDLDFQKEDVEIESFVHGALCVSYSGQCFSSEAWGGRSANRGQCAQACRLPYGLIQNGELVDLQDMSYLLSPQDLCGLDQVEDLIRAGVSCLKIEGRLKDENYVAATTRAYRNKVDEVWAKITKERGDKMKVSRTRILESREEVTTSELAQLFSRGQDATHNGLTPGFFEGSQHQRLVIGRNPRHRGVYCGEVMANSSWKSGLIIQGDGATLLKRGDGIVIDRGMPQEEELGGPIFDIQDLEDGNVVIYFGREVQKRWKRIDDLSRKGQGSRMPLAPVGAHVWKTSDATVDKKMKKLVNSAPPKSVVNVSIRCEIGQQIKVEIKDLVTGKVGQGRSENVLEQADQRGIDESSVLKAFGKLGGTDFIINEDDGFHIYIEDNTWGPISWVKKARQEAVNNLQKALSDRSENQSYIEIEDDEVCLQRTQSSIVEDMINHRTENEQIEDNTSSSPILTILARNPEQVNALCDLVESGEKIDEIIVDFLEVDGMKDAVSRIRQIPNIRTVLATPRILKPGEDNVWKTLLRMEPDGLLIRSTGLLQTLMKMGGTGSEICLGEKVCIPELIGDFSLNAVNSLTIAEMLDNGLKSITASYELSANSITELAKVMGPSRASQLEVVAHAHLPIFHTEHCVFARFLSKGNSYLDCGHVCTKNTVHLRDPNGSDNLVLADMGCRNTVFSAEAQSGVHSLKDWREAGVGRIRLELVDENEENVKKIVKGYLAVLNNNEKPSECFEMLKSVCDSNGRTGGVGYGSLRNTSERRAGEL